MNARREKIKVKDMTTLQEEKRRLKRLCVEIEDQLDRHFDYLKDNYGKLTFNTVFPGSPQKEGNVFKWARGLTKIAWKAEKVQPLLTSAAINIAEIIAARYGLKFFSRLLGKFARKSIK